MAYGLEIYSDDGSNLVLSPSDRIWSLIPCHSDSGYTTVITSIYIAADSMSSNIYIEGITSTNQSEIGVLAYTADGYTVTPSRLDRAYNNYIKLDNTGVATTAVTYELLAFRF